MCEANVEIDVEIAELLLEIFFLRRYWNLCQFRKQESFSSKKLTFYLFVLGSELSSEHYAQTHIAKSP